MIKVEHAECKRVLERNDQLYVDVEVKLEGQDNKLVALFADSGEADYEIMMILEKDAQTDIDWYDNDLHAAYKDVTTKWIEDQKVEGSGNQKDALKQNILSYGEVKQEIAAKLDEAKKEKIEA